MKIPHFYLLTLSWGWTMSLWYMAYHEFTQVWCLQKCLHYQYRPYFFKGIEFMELWYCIIIQTSVVAPCCWQERARSCLRYLVSQLANMEHSFHHILLLEIKSITDAFSSILGPHSRDIFRMSNSFTNIAKLLSRRLENSAAGNGRYL